MKIKFQDFLDKLTLVVGGISPRIRQLLEVAQIRYLVDIGTPRTLAALCSAIETRMETIEPGFRLEPMDKVALSDIQRRLNLEGPDRFLEQLSAEEPNSWQKGKQLKPDAFKFIYKMISDHCNERPVRIVRLLQCGAESWKVDCPYCDRKFTLYHGTRYFSANGLKEHLSAKHSME